MIYCVLKGTACSAKLPQIFTEIRMGCEIYFERAVATFPLTDALGRKALDPITIMPCIKQLGHLPGPICSSKSVSQILDRITLI